MGQLAEKIFASSFDTGLVNQYCISFSIHAGGYSFLVMDGRSGKVQALGTVPFDSVSDQHDAYALILQETGLPENRLKAVNFLVPVSFYTLIPGGLFREEASVEYLRFVFPDRSFNRVEANYLAHEDFWIVWDNPLIENQPVIRLFPHIQSQLETVRHAFHGHDGSRKVTAHKRPGYADIIVVKDGQPVFCNSFSVRADEDFLYFLLNVLEQLEINAESETVYLTGDVIPGDSLHRLLANYVRFVDFGLPGGHAPMGEGMDDVLLHRYFPLYNPLLCV